MEELKAQIAPTFNNMVKAIQRFSHSGFNAIPFEGSWTPGQIAAHVKMSVQGIPELFTSETRPANRKADEKVQMVADVFLDFGKKYDSPEAIVPKQKEYDQERFIAFFSEYSDALQAMVSQLDMSEICLGFEIPGFGPMTRLEFLSFVLFHTQRHTHQMEKIATS